MESEIKEDFTKYSPSDPELIDKIVNTIKSKGIFDQFRKDCLADVDTKPAYQNLQRRVNGTVNGFLKSQKWPSSQNKTQLRESLRKHTVKQPFLEAGVDRIVDQVVMPKIYSVFHPKVEEIVYEALGIERPKPKPKALLDLKLDFQNFKKSLNESESAEKEKVRERAEPPLPSHPSDPAKTAEELIAEVKVEEDSQATQPDAPHTPPPLETNGEAEPAHPEATNSPASEKSASMFNNDDDSNTIDEMPLLAASMDTSSNRATTPVRTSGKNDGSMKAENYSDSDSHSLPSSHPPMEFDSSNNLSSLKSDFKVSPSKKFDNFSNLGEKLKQSDVNLRETTPIKAEDITEESSEVTKSSEHDSESIDLNMEVHSDSNTSALDNSKFLAVKNEIPLSSHLSDDSMSSTKSKSKSQDFRKEEKRHSDKRSSENKSKDPLPEPITVKEEKDKEKSGRNPEDDKKEYSKSSSKKGDYKSKHRDSSKDKSRSHRHRDDKHKSKDGHSSERNGKHDSEKDADEKKEKTDDFNDKKSGKHRNDDTKPVSEDSDSKKKRDEKSRHSKDDRDSKNVKKGEDNAKAEEKEKEKFKTPEKEKKVDDRSRSDRRKSRNDSSSKSNHSKSGDRKSTDDKKKHDKKSKEDDKKSREDSKKEKEDDKKKDSKKKKSGKCDENDSKSKNPRRSSDRDSNGNAGGGSDKTKPAGSSQSPKKSSKSEQKTRSRYKDPSNSDALDADDDSLQVDEVDLLLLQVNNSIENEQQRLDVREILSEPSVAQTIKPKIAMNFHEIRKIMQARKNMGKVTAVDEVPCSEDQCDALPSCVGALLDNNEDMSSGTSDGESMNERVDGDEVPLKKLSVVITDVLKDFTKKKSLPKRDLTRNLGVTVFLGSSDEILRVEKCVAVPSSPLHDIATAESELQTHKTPEKAVLPAENITEGPADISCYVDNGMENPGQRVDEKPSKFRGQGESKTEVILVDVEKTAREPVGQRLEPVKPSSQSNEAADNEHCVESRSEPIESTKPVISFIEADDEHSIESGKSYFSYKAETEDGDWVEPADSDASSQCSQVKSKSMSKLMSKQSSSEFVPLPGRSTSRKNAGNRMYAILEEVSTSKHSNAPVRCNTKRKTAKSRSNSDSERLGASDSPKAAVHKGENSSVAVETSCSKDGTDDGSDVSNKENDEKSASGNSQSKNQKVELPNPIETRLTRKRNPGLDKPDDSNIFKPDGSRNSGTKTRSSLSSKNSVNDVDAPIQDGGSEKSRFDVTTKPITWRSTLSLSSKAKESDEGWSVKAHASSSSKANESVRKSLECLQMEKENITVLNIAAHSQSNESTSLQTSALSPRRKSCPDILHPRDHCENKEPETERHITRREGQVETSTDGTKTDNLPLPKIIAVEGSKTIEGPQKQFEYQTRNVNSRRKSICNDERVQNQEYSEESDKSTNEEVQVKIEESDHSCNSETVCVGISANKDEVKVAAAGITTRRSKSKVKSSESAHKIDNVGLESQERSPKVYSMSDTGVLKPSKRTKDIGTAEASQSLSRESQPEKEMAELATLEKRSEAIITSAEVAGSSDQRVRESDGLAKKTATSSVPEEEESCSTENVKKEPMTRKRRTGTSVDSLSELKGDKLDERAACIAAERPKRKIHRPSWLNENAVVPGMPAIGDGSSKSTVVAHVHADAEARLNHPCSNSVRPSKTGTDAVIAGSKQPTDCDGQPKNKLSSKRVASTFAELNAEEDDKVNGESASKKPAVGTGEDVLGHPLSPSNPRYLKHKHITMTSAVDLTEDSASGSSLEFRGFYEEDAGPDSDVECFGFSDGEIERAAAQLRFLTHFIANHPTSGTRPSKTSRPLVKKMRLPSEGTGRSCANEAASESGSKAAKKRKLSLSSTPEMDKKDMLVEQCKAESKDSGLHESPEQPSFATNIAQKTVSVEHRTPVNGIRTKSARTPAPRPLRSKTEPTSNSDAQSRNSQSYCASDLYKPRPSFARDVRAVKRTASSAESPTIGRTKKRSR